MNSRGSRLATMIAGNAMKTSTDRILTTHVGSLPRPQPVVDLLAQRELGTGFDETAFYRAMKHAVSAVVTLQREAGVDIVSDGEQSKASYASYIKDRLSGFSGTSAPIRGADLDEYPNFAARLMKRREGAIKLNRPCCTGPIALRNDQPLREDLANFEAALANAAQLESPAIEGFLNAASPGVLAVFQQNQHYASHTEYLQALADAMRAEYRAIVKAGFVLQIDCPDLAMGRHIPFKHETTEQFLVHVHEQIEVLNAALTDLPADRIRIHLCWGNYEGPHHRDVELNEIFDAVMTIRAQGLLFEAANPRHAHEWIVFEQRKAQIPDDKILIPGVIQSTSNYIEHPQLIAQRLERFADIVGRERVIAGSDCGFSTFAGDGLVEPAIVWAKLRAMSEGAAIASGRLWRTYTGADNQLRALNNIGR